MKTLNEKVAVVTGAAMGMGLRISEKLLSRGCRVALVDIAAGPLEKAAAELAATGDCRAYVCDISDRQAVAALAAEIARDMGTVSILVNNAGIVSAGHLVDLDEALIEKMIAVNLTSMFWTCKAFLPQMTESGEGHIVNMASAGGLLAIPSLSAYCASKFGVVGFTDALRQEMAKCRHPVGVTVVCPNTVGTGMFEGARMVAGTKLLDPDVVAERVMAAIEKNRPMVAVPWLPVRLLTPLTKTLLPIRAMDWLNKILGMWHANDTWTGRGATN